jgi:hypothetical protein
MTTKETAALTATVTAVLAFLISTILVSSAFARPCNAGDPRTQDCKYDAQGGAPNFGDPKRSLTVPVQKVSAPAHPRKKHSSTPDR